jgi:ribosomal protein S2
VAIANNKSNKSLGLIFWLLAREYMKAHDIDKPLPSLEDFVGEKLILEEPRKKKKAADKKEAELKIAENAIEERMRQIAEAEDAKAEDAREDSESISVGEEVTQGV